MNVKYIDIAKQNNLIKDELLLSIEKVIISSQFILGEEVSKLENNICNLLNAKYAVGVNSGTDALILSLKALGIKKGDEVITVANSFIATALAISMVDAKPVFIEINDKQLIETKDIENKITKNTKAILPVHLMGMPANMNKVLKIARKYNLKVIEDAAQAIGAKYNDKMIGSIGDLACFSFHPLKNLSAIGDGGIITTNNKKLYEKLIYLRNLGLVNRNECEYISSNSRLDSVQAAVLNTKLKYLDTITKRKREIANIYLKELKELSEITLPTESKKSFCVYHTFVIQVHSGKRDKLQAYLDTNNIETKIHYPIAIHHQKVYKKLNYKLPKTEKIVSSILSLPIDYTLTDEEIYFVSTKIKEFFN